ncbi:TPA: TIGR00159 family protein [Candidatus Avigastranaerophilus faecigallinarum]|nr:TIGR00159 family protein [Candidatus Avigastranaerophilus faecigallinarum]
MLENVLKIYSNFLNSSEIVWKATTFTFKDFFQILIVVLIISYVYMKFIRNTQAEKLVRGILFFIIAAWIFSAILIALEFQILGQIAQYLLTGILLSMVIVFQPELRKLLVHLGQTKFVAKNFFSFKKDNNEQRTNVIKEITEAVKYCSRVKRGALIVVQKELDKSFYNEVGTTINADISTELILTIFFPNTPLHDGAMVIHKDKILAAGVLLPLTEDPKLSWRYGTRHRAAIGASEISDSACIVVSEETGDISIAIDGILRKYEDIAKFKEDLERIIGNDSEKIENAFMQNIWKLRKK